MEQGEWRPHTVRSPSLLGQIILSQSNGWSKFIAVVRANRICIASTPHRVLFSATSCCCCWVTTPECRINGEILVGLWLGICSTRQPWTMCFALLFFCGCCQQFNSSRRRRRIMHITICTVHGWMDWAGRSNRIRIYRSRAGIRYGIGGGSGQIVSSWAINQNDQLLVVLPASKGHMDGCV